MKACVFLIVLAITIVFNSAAQRVFTHPGIYNSQTELDAIKTNVNGSKDHPMKAGWEKLLESEVSKMSYKPAPYEDIILARNTAQKTAFRNDGRAAFSHALQWVVTGDKKYADKAIEIFNAWAGVLKIITRDGEVESYVSLVSSWNVHIWMAAAEIIKHYNNGAAGWTEQDQDQFNQMAQVFKKSLLAWSGHAGYNIDAVVDAAEIQWHQGIDLYDRKFGNEDIPRILKGVEYFAKATVKPPVMTSFGANNMSCNTLCFSNEIANNHYRNRLKGKYTILYLDDAVFSGRPTGGGVGGGKFIPFTTLTHAQLSIKQ